MPQPPPMLYWSTGNAIEEHTRGSRREQCRKPITKFRREAKVIKKLEYVTPLDRVKRFFDVKIED